MRVAGIARTDCVRLGPRAAPLARAQARWPGAKASLGIDYRRDPPPPSLTSHLATPTTRPILFSARHGLFKPSHILGWTHAAGGQEPPRGQSAGRAHRAGEMTSVEASLAPQSKPVTQASRLVARGAPSVASRLGPGILTAERAQIRLYSQHGHLCAPDPKNVVWRRRRRLDSSPAAGPVSPAACPPRNHKPRASACERDLGGERRRLTCPAERETQLAWRVACNGVEAKRQERREDRGVVDGAW